MGDSRLYQRCAFPLKHGNVLPRRRPVRARRGRMAMTVCIAAIAAQSKAIVLVADKSVSYLDERGNVRQRFDVAFEKIRQLKAPGWAALISGPMDFGVNVAQLADANFYVEAGATATDDNGIVILRPLSEHMKSAYQICRRQEVIDRVLAPRLLSKEWFDTKVNEGASKKNDDYFLEIESLVANFDNTSSILLCGFENGSPEIHLVVNPGVLGSETPTGLAAIGIGQDTALNRLYALETDPRNLLSKVLYDCFDAKEACSQSLSEVGREWDAFVVTDGQVVKVPEELQVLIEQVYDNYAKSPFPVIGGSETPEPPPNWRRQLEEFSEFIIPGTTQQPLLYSHSTYQPSSLNPQQTKVDE